MNKSIRIRTTPGGSDNYVKIKLDQDFDFIEILSLKITQEQVYRKFCSDYGVIVGRVIANNGFGVPNARLSIFIPITDEDKENSLINGIYPYSNVTDKDSNGIRYNLLTKKQQSECHTPVGTMPSKNEFLDNDVMVEIYDKYYKYSTTTNESGDYMIFGVPTGQYILHMDVDISDVGVLSQRPYDMIRQGSNIKQFESPTKFKSSKKLDILTQIKSSDIGVNIQPFWGDNEICEVGMSRVDIDLPYFFEPSAIFIGSLFSDNEKHGVNKNCRPRKKTGLLCEMVTGEGTIQMIRKTIDGSIERYDVDGGRVIDEDGTWAYQIPMNLDYMVTDEYGNLIPTNDISKGVPTRAEVRFRISMDQTGGEGRLRTRASYLIPNNPSNSQTGDYEFGINTKNESFTELKWNKLYTIKNLITRYQKNKNDDNRNFIGIKNVDNCGSHTSFPFNRIDTDFNPLYTILCFITSILSIIISSINTIIVGLINGIISVLNRILSTICNTLKGITNLGVPNGIDISDFTLKYWYPFEGKKEDWCIGDYVSGVCNCGNIITYLKCITLECSNIIYAPGCVGKGLIETKKGYSDVNTSKSNLDDCIRIQLGDTLNIFEFEFYNDWINGSLYLPLLKYKKKNDDVEKFCEYDCGPNYDSNETDNKCNNFYLVDTCVDGNNKDSDENSVYSLINEGIVKKYGEYFYYASTTHIGNKAMLPTDIMLLGSTLPCDADGLPIIHDLLIPTTYNMPETIPSGDVGEEDGEIGIIPLFFNDITCFDFKVDSNNCENISSACELGIDLGNNDTIGNDDINDTLVRQQIIGMSSGSNDFTTINSNIRDVNGLYYKKDGFIINNYFQYRGISNDKTNLKIPRGGSFYFYFGIIPGKSAIEKANSKYFTSCDTLVKNDFIVDGNITNVTSIGGSDGQITLNIIGGTPPFNYVWSNGETTETIIDLPVGTYNVIVTEISGQGLSSTGTFTVYGPLPLSFSLTSNNVSQNGLSDGTINVDLVYGGSEPYTAEITTPSGIYPSQNIINNSTIFTGLPSGNYEVTVTDSNDISSTLPIIISEPDSLYLEIKKSDIKCRGFNSGGITITIAGGELPYLISTIGPNNYTSTLYTQTNLYPGQYDVTVMDSIGQTATGSVTIIEPLTSPSFTYLLDNIICNNGTATIEIIGSGGSTGFVGYNYSIDGGSTWETTSIFSGLTEGYYDLIIKDSKGCLSTSENVIITNPTILNNDSISSNAGELTFSASGGWGGYTYNIDGGEYLYNDTTITGLSSATYTIGVKDSEGCIALKDVVVS